LTFGCLILGADWERRFFKRVLAAARLEGVPLA